MQSVPQELSQLRALCEFQMSTNPPSPGAQVPELEEKFFQLQEQFFAIQDSVPTQVHGELEVLGGLCDQIFKGYHSVTLFFTKELKDSNRLNFFFVQ